MKIFDCFMYFDEETILDLRLNALDKYVDYFVIVESVFNHRGLERKLTFNHNRFNRFRDKIIYLNYDKKPKEIKQILDSDLDFKKTGKYILNAALRENGQRNFISNGIQKAKDDDVILISDVDEIPNLENLNFKEIKQKIILFKQDMFYYKFNLRLPNLIFLNHWGDFRCFFLHPFVPVHFKFGDLFIKTFTNTLDSIFIILNTTYRSHEKAFIFFIIKLMHFRYIATMLSKVRRYRRNNSAHRFTRSF